ncbi:unnamed protein product, partial [Ectocarpus sp. 12 AP-2014]
VHTPYLLITALRNPLEVFVSGQQYIQRKETKTLGRARDFVVGVMRKNLRKIYRPKKKAKKREGLGNTADSRQQGRIGGYIRTFVG